MEATQRHLDDQRRGVRADLSEIDQIIREKRETEKALKEAHDWREALNGDQTEVRQSSRAR